MIPSRSMHKVRSLTKLMSCDESQNRTEQRFATPKVPDRSQNSPQQRSRIKAKSFHTKGPGSNK